MNLKINHRKTKVLRIGNVEIGGSNPVVIQSMTNTKTADIEATVSQILRLEEAGCQIVRVAVLDEAAARAICEIKKRISIPLVADIHFDYRLALISMEAGADKIRINPGNMGGIEKLKLIVDMAKERSIPIRIGVNSGSLEKDILEKYGHPVAEALVESCLRNAGLLEELGFSDIVLSMKSSDVMTTIEAYRIASEKCKYPLHVGVTEAGTLMSGTVKSSIGIGTLLYMGIGDTIRVSLTCDPVQEIHSGKEILRALGILKSGVELISCPTCGRCSVELEKLANQVEELVRDIKTDKHIKLAVMGCGVNGPGEAKEADLGIAGGVGEFMLFIKGKVVQKIREEDALEALMTQLRKLL